MLARVHRSVCVDRWAMSNPPLAALPREFYARSPLVVARALLGKKLVRFFHGALLAGEIVEVEAYRGERDSASHAFRGPTPRNAVMFGPPGHAYVYFVYGMHYCMNVVTGKPGRASAVLIRGLRPLSGVATMQRLRHGRKHIADGPARLCEALAVDRRLDGHDLTSGQAIWIEPYRRVARGEIATSPRIGIAYAQPSDRDAHWRFFLSGALAPAGKQRQSR